MKFEKIKSIKGVGLRKAYDLSIEGVHKGYLVNGFQTHNSGGDFRSDFSLADSVETFEDGRMFKRKYPEVTDIAIGLEGQVRNCGVHAAAIILSSEDLRLGQRSSLKYGKEKELVVNWDKYDIEHFGLMKLDVLGLNALTILNETKKMIERSTGEAFDLFSIPLEDKKVLDNFTKGDCIGIFQFSSLGLRKLCRNLIIDNFDLLVAANALHRPGTIRSGMMTHFIDRKRGREKWTYLHPFLEAITKETYGIILYQEQVMRFMYDLGGLPWRTADTVRKVISKSQGVEQFMKFKQLFADGCVEKKTLSREVAEKLWEELSSFGSYSFNKAHSVEYTLIGFWQMYLKTYYFKEFMCCSLSFGADGKKEDLVEECFAKDITISAPKVGISKDLEWRFKDDVLYMPFKEIKGIGEASAKKLSEMNRDGFFKGKYKLSPKINSLLAKLKAFEDDLLTEEEILECSEFFPFSINKDKSFRYKKFVEKIEEATSVNTLSELPELKERTDILLLGTMTEIKFGYRGKIDTIEKKLGISGIAGNLGGVYGNFRDSSDFMMLVFDAGIYNRKKYKVEHCSKKFLLAKINVISRTTDFNIMCNDAWFEDEILSCELDGLGVDFRKKKRFKNNDLLSCELCELRSECSAPVLPSLGIYNIMIVAEAPGKTENAKGKGLVGASGDILWKELSLFGYNRSGFHVTNVVKCFPSQSKTPSHKQIKSCSKWLDEEIKILEPPMILAIGNVALKYFTGEDSGIMAKNGTTEWIEKFGCWVSWCIHPASVLYHRENMDIFSKGIKNFTEKLGTISQVKEEK